MQKRAAKKQCPGLAVVLAVALALAGCANDRAQVLDLSKPPPAGTARFVARHYDLVMVYPDTLDAAHAFESDYFLGNRWNPQAAANIPGAALLSLTLPGSNPRRRAVLRLGASDDTRAVDDCLDARANGLVNDRARQVTLDGVDFIRADARDAGMSHYQRVRHYRGVHEHQCIAIDLFVTGTEPGVYAGTDAPTKPPLSTDDAMQQLTRLLDGLAFVDAR